jgi:Spy/CpxP family protein refolding chaperone
MFALRNILKRTNCNLELPMNRTISAMMLAGMVGFGLQAVAADPPPDPASPSSPGQMSSDGSQHMHMTPDQRKFMKDCMTKAKASNNGMSDQDMKKSCHDQLKASAGSGKDAVTPAH